MPSPPNALRRSFGRTALAGRRAGAIRRLLFAHPGQLPVPEASRLVDLEQRVAAFKAEQPKIDVWRQELWNGPQRAGRGGFIFYLSLHR